MVMESATLSGPQKKCNVVPVQKSLSLPSYARVGGEGIDHRLIFAALEQKEKIRRKSKIFTRQKPARQNIFCLPISTGSKCRETSLSSDTSCSSLEYQKPKPAIKTKKEGSQLETKQSNNDQTPKTNQIEPKSNSECVQKNIMPTKISNGHLEENHLKNNRSPVDTLRLHVGSSDSMERSSRSSNDSLTRKERLTALKARVEAEREKYGDSSSDEESSSNITRYNSDGLIHRTVREVKSRSYRHDRRLRRRSQGEWVVKKNDRKNNLSLCLNPEEDGIQLHLEKLDRLNFEINNLEVKTDYCPSPVFPDVTRKSYFSDFPSKESSIKFVQQRIKHIEEEEKKRNSGCDFFENVKTSQNSPLLTERSSTPTKNLNKFEKKNYASNSISDVKSQSRSNEFIRRASPIPKSNQAPPPPPRSPKSINFINKAFLHHQKSPLQQEINSDKNTFIKSSTSVSSLIQPKDAFNSKSDACTRDYKNNISFRSNTAEKQQMRELFNARRKTCGNFDFVDDNILSDLCSSLKTATSSNRITSNNSQSTSLTEIENIDCKSCTSKFETPSVEENKNKSNVNKWEESERRREFMFNSLENKKKSNILPWAKKKISAANTDPCICYVGSGSNLMSNCQNCVPPPRAQNIPNDNMQSYNFRDKSIFEPNLENWKIKDNSNDVCTYLSEFNRMNECKTSEIRNKTKNLNSQSRDSCESNTREFLQSDTLKNIFSFRSCNESKHDHSSIANTSSKPVNEFQGLNQFYEKTSTDSKVWSTTDSTATANLESAMAELESVYLSLKFSSDNLTDNNSPPNLSLSDDDSKVSNKKSDNDIHKRSHLKRNSFQETDPLFDVLLLSDTKKSYDKHGALFNNTNTTHFLEKQRFSSTTNTVNKDSSINQLFKDLTPQLNVIDKNIDTCNDTNSLTIGFQKSSQLNDKVNLNPSPVSFKKEFYENLQKQQVATQKKKLKAVRSLSENISQLMNSENGKLTNKNIPEKSYYQPTNNLSPSGKNTQNSRTIDNKYESTSNPSKTVNSSSPKQNSSNKEIRHIRVSMDSMSAQPIQASVSSCSNTSQHPRLSSAVHTPQMSPNCEITKPFQFKSYGNSKETIENTIDGLEELLNSLLVDIPESKRSSLPKKKDSVPTSSSSSLSAGEMRVLQHLDVIRLKPVPT